MRTDHRVQMTRVAAAVGAANATASCSANLNLVNRRIDHKGATAIAEALRGNRVLKELNLRFNSIGPTGATALADALKVNGVLTELDLGRNQIRAEGATALASALEVNGVLTELNLADNDVGDKGATALASALEVNRVLTSLDVGGNRLTEEAALGIVRVERQRNKLTSLGLAFCSMGPTGAAEIADYVSGSGVLTSLYLNGNQLCGIDNWGEGTYSAAGITALAEALKVNGVLTNLNLFHNRIGPTGATALADALRVNGVLTNLDLSGNNIGESIIKASEVKGESNEVGAKVVYQGREMVVSQGVDSDGDLVLSDATGVLAIAKALEVNGVLKSINLCDNSLGTEGWCAIFAALRDNKENKIESWDLHYQSINTEIAKVLAEYVSVSGVLTNLNLYDNSIGPTGATALADALCVNGALKELDLSYNGVGLTGATALADALKVNGVLTTLNLRANNLGDEGKGVIRDAVSGREGFELQM